MKEKVDDLTLAYNKTLFVSKKISLFLEFYNAQRESPNFKN